jgi:hypothetical protein
MWWLGVAVVIEMVFLGWYFERYMLWSHYEDFSAAMLFWLIVVTFAGIDLVWFAVLAVRAWAGVLG